MLTGVSYEKVWLDQTSAFSKEEVLNFSPLTWSVYLSYLGFEYGYFCAEGYDLDRLAGFPRGVRYFCGVGLDANHPKSDPDNTHAIVLDEDGTVFDPASDGPGALGLEYYRTTPRRLLLVASVQDRRLLHQSS
jgi:hypothetical protein